MDSILHPLFYQPIMNLLVLLYNTFNYNIGIAIIILAILFKLVTFPLTILQKKSQSNAADMNKILEEIKEKYKTDPEKMAIEQAKAQAAMSKGAIGGCLVLIFTIIIIFQIRLVVLDLNNKGWLAFNDVSYNKSLNKQLTEFNIEIIKDKVRDGENTLQLDIDNEYKIDLKFWAYKDDSSKESRVKSADDYLNKNQNQYGQKKGTSGTILINSIANNNKQISIFNKELQNDFVINQKDLNNLKFVVRVNGENKFKVIKVSLNDSALKTDFKNGESINLNFLGVDLSKTAVDVSQNGLLKDLFTPAIFPYLLASVFSGLIQFFSMKYMMTTQPTVVNKDKEDVSNELENITKSMNSGGMSVIFVILNIVVSLGVLGGGQFVPMGLTLFWTIQSLSGIIESYIQKRLQKSI